MIAQSLLALSLERPAPIPGQWSKVAVHSSGVVARAETTGGGDIGFQVAGHGMQIVNTYTIGTQDEPAVAATPEGFIVAWDQRHPIYMHIDYRLYDVAGNSLSLPVQIDEQPTAWRPLIVPRADGVVAFLYTGGWDNHAWLRLLSPSGAWLTSSMDIGTNVNGDQEDPCGCWLDNGDLFIVFTDFHGGPGVGLELMQRVFRFGQGWLAQPARLLATPKPGDDRWPTCALVNGEPYVAFQDPQGAWLKRGIDTPLLIGPGKLPEVAGPHVVYERAGNILEWPSGQQLNTLNVGACQRPSAAVTPSGALLVGWHGGGQAFVRAFHN